MLYPSVETHAALAGRAREDARDPALVATFRAQQLLAEHLLGLVLPIVTAASDLASIALALALQINHQYTLGHEAFVYASLTTQPNQENRTFRTDLSLVYPLARTIVDSVLYPDGYDIAGDFATVTSVRGPQA